MFVRVVVLVAVVLGAAPLVPADASSCQPVTDSSAVSFGGVYYAKIAALDGGWPPARVRVWAESNGLEGLQTASTSCGYGAPLVPPDTRLADSAQALA